MPNQTDTFAIKLGEIWKRARTEKQWSQRQAADAIGFSDSEISLYESGKRIPSFERIVEMCDAYQIDIADIAATARATKPGESK